MLRKASSSHSAEDPTAASMTQSQPGPSPLRPGLLRTPSSFKAKLQQLKHALHRPRSVEKTGQHQEQANPRQGQPHQTPAQSSQGAHAMTQDDSLLFSRPRRSPGLSHSYHGRIQFPKSTPASPSPSPIVFRPGGPEGESSASSTPFTAPGPTFPPNTSTLLTPPHSLATAPTTAFSPIGSSLKSSPLATDLLAENKTLKSTVAQLQLQNARQVKIVQDLFSNTIVPRVTSFVEKLDSETRARKLAEERFAREFDAHSRTDEMRLEERERRWDMEEEMLESKRDFKEMQKKYAELEAKFLDLQVQTDFLQADALQDSLRRLGIFDIPNHQLCCAMFEDCVEVFLRQTCSAAEYDREQRNAQEKQRLKREWEEERDRVAAAYRALEKSEDEESYSGDDEREGPPSDGADSPKWFKKKLPGGEDGTPSPDAIQFEMIKDTILDQTDPHAPISGPMDPLRAAFDKFGRQTKDLRDVAALLAAGDRSRGEDGEERDEQESRRDRDSSEQQDEDEGFYENANADVPHLDFPLTDASPAVADDSKQ
ncbi:hypothetical protein FRC04_008008 [Tulasnella sp. 424]|nr:hypothetical protein FRC04_008008 [Tulasnella sp. 424]KAG8974865.1 hypothetical protein FRC05_006798 [Tulasnella sp. 425]